MEIGIDNVHLWECRVVSFSCQHLKWSGFSSSRPRSVITPIQCRAHLISFPFITLIKIPLQWLIPTNEGFYSMNAHFCGSSPWGSVAATFPTPQQWAEDSLHDSFLRLFSLGQCGSHISYTATMSWGLTVLLIFAALLLGAVWQPHFLHHNNELTTHCIAMCVPAAGSTDSSTIGFLSTLLNKQETEILSIRQGQQATYNST